MSASAEPTALRLGGPPLFELPLDALPEAPAADWLAQHLHPQELARWSAYGLPKRRREWLAGRLCAKAALRALLAPAPPPHAALRIEPDAAGRPRAPGHALHLSISHSRRRAVAAAAALPLGIDTESHEALGAASLEALLTPAEVALTARHFGCGEAAARTLLWCLKEARFKCQGRGGFVGQALAWRLRAWSRDDQPRWADAGAWPAPPPGCRWEVRLRLDAQEACVLVRAGRQNPFHNNPDHESRASCMPTA